MARYPVPSHVIESIDAADLRGFGAAHLARRAANRRTIARLSEKLNAVFDSGVPFFTKDAIRDIVRQLDELAVNPNPRVHTVRKFIVRGLDDCVVELRVPLGRVHPYRDLPDVDIVDAKLLVRFRPIDHLTSTTRRFADEFNIEHAFLPMVVEPRPVQLHSVTNDYVPQYPVLPLEAVQATLQRKRTEWESSSACQQLLSTLRSAAIPDVRRIVAFACFNMSDCEMAERSACQHALLLILRKFFAERQRIAEEDIVCFAQDPLYEDVDKKVLAGAGISVVENPRAFLEVDDASLVLSISPETPVRQIVADIAQPAVMIWNRVEEVEQHAEWIGQTEWYGPPFQIFY
ncbi:hypothetical protein GGS23DRAFT_577629 [Durotheca rogersii]|uniref:uncharacterized protein n=1 Tax=Durotheca rogersii TaxID=419775 RepID=UPI002220F470|nr:uncharacterized protein GGS23DRAFT_577629 [Durotheca rogersii]KAI5861222.1 hypothetical protein GGS23DRAFT_577629 [Durotheca rogersii]